jgi:hypothetical protein
MKNGPADNAAFAAFSIVIHKIGDCWWKSEERLDLFDLG